MKYFAILFLFLAGCASKPAYLLEWNADGEAVHKYNSAIAAPMPEHYIVQKDAFELAANPSDLDKALEVLKRIPLNPQEMSLVTTVSKQVQQKRLEIQMVVGKAVYTTPPKDEMEETKRKIESQSEDMIQLYAHTDFFGKNESFFLKQVQKNLVALFFQLPEKPTRVGNQWTLPTHLIEIGSGFIPKDSQMLNKVWIRSSYEDPQLGTVLEIVYLIGEKISGNFVQTTKTKEATPPFELLFSYIAHGEYVPSKGEWKRYVGQMSTRGTGSIQVNSNNLYALYPIQ